MAERNASFATSKEILELVRDSRITKIELGLNDIETILDTLVYDGKVERSITGEDRNKIYRAISSYTNVSSLVTTACGVCPLMSQCGDVGLITPLKCLYMKQWLEEW